MTKNIDTIAIASQLKEIINLLEYTEKLGREIASLQDVSIYDFFRENYKKIQKMRSNLEDALDSYETLIDLITQPNIKPEDIVKLNDDEFSDIYDMLKTSMNILENIVVYIMFDYCKNIVGDNKNIKECIILNDKGEIIPNIPEHIKEKISETLSDVDSLNELSKDLIGTKCTWLFGEHYPYSVTALINDVTACIHRDLEKIRESVPNDLLNLQKEGKCLYTKDNYNKKLLLACKEWESQLDENRRNGIVDKGLFNMASAFIQGNNMEIKVGLAEGHRVHINLDNKTLEYYDNDDNVKKTVSELLEEHSNVKCESFDFGLKCKNIDENNINKISKVISFITSMDNRLYAPFEYYDTEEYLDCTNIIETEKCLINQYIK